MALTCLLNLQKNYQQLLYCMVYGSSIYINDYLLFLLLSNVTEVIIKCKLQGVHCQACETQQRDAQHHIFQLDTFSIMVRKQPHIVKVGGIQLYQKPGAMKQNIWLIFTDQPDTNQCWSGMHKLHIIVNLHFFKPIFGLHLFKYLPLSNMSYFILHVSLSLKPPL